MLKNKLIQRHPIKQLGFETDEILSADGFGAVLAHAGVGKTALLVQLALNAMLRGRHVLHLSLIDPVNKVTLWYKELFQNLVGTVEGSEIKQLWDAILPLRFIMTFRVESFSVPKLEERINDLTEQGIFSPELLIVDGLNFDESNRGDLEALKALASRHTMPVWFTVHTHRHEQPGLNGLPLAFSPLADLFELILELQPDHADVFIRILKGAVCPASRLNLLLDPATMLIKDRP